MKTRHYLLLSIITFLFVLAITFNTKAQTPDWLWAKSFGGWNTDQIGNITTDINGYLYMTGLYAGPSVTIGTTTLTNNGNGGMFLVKYDIFGNVLWVKSPETSDYGKGAWVTIGQDGYIYVTGSFIGSITFGIYNLTNPGGSGTGMFIVKYNSNGDVIWAQSGTGHGGQDGRSVVVNQDGDIYVTGNFNGPTITFGTTILSNSGQNDIFLVKYDHNGDVIWATSAVGDKNEFPTCLSQDIYGNIYISGNYASGNLTFGSTTLHNNSINGDNDLFIAKYSPNGTIIWALSAGGNGIENAIGCCNDKFGNLFFCGSFTSPSVTIGPITLTNVSTSPNADMFIVKLGSTGNLLWGRSFGGPLHESCKSIGTDSIGDVIFTGYFASSHLSIGSTTLNSNGNSKMLIGSLDSDGNPLWAKSLEGAASSIGRSVALDNAGNLYLAGTYSGGSIIFGTTTFDNTGTDDIFIVRLNETVNSIQETRDETLSDLSPNPSHGYFHINGMPKDGCKIRIYSILGSCIYQSRLSNQQNTIDLSIQNKGTYFYQVLNDQKILKTGKIIIE